MSKTTFELDLVFFFLHSRIRTYFCHSKNWEHVFVDRALTLVNNHFIYASKACTEFATVSPDLECPVLKH